MTLADLKPGDLVAYCFCGPMATSPNQMRICSVAKVTAKAISVNGNTYSRDTGGPARGSRGWIRLATEEEVTAWQAKTKEEQQKRREREERESKADYRLASRFANTMTEEWIALGENRLRQIADWLDGK